MATLDSRSRPASVTRAAVGGPTGREIRELLALFHEVTGVAFAATLLRNGGGGVELHDSLGRPGVARRTTVAGDLELRLRFADESAVDGPAAGMLERWLDALVRREREVRLFSREMAERYEEITLLTSISETLGSHLHLQSAAEAILAEVAAALDVERVALWLEEGDEDSLELFASYGRGSADEGEDGSDPVKERARALEAFRRQETLLGDHAAPGADRGGGAVAGDVSAATAPSPRVLTLPVNHSPAEGPTRQLGVLHVAGAARPPFTAGDLQLVGAVASQIGAAVQNDRLVRDSLQRERMQAELDIAHDLQLKLLPNLEGFSDLAEIAARCEPAHSVGGDFYLLIRLSEGRIGIMLGDVSSHGLSAALIMALTMSAAAIYARENERPGDVVLDIHRELLRELESTDMYMTLFYGVLDVRDGVLRYANAGHGYAFRIDDDGGRRLEALDPPVGMTAPDTYREKEEAWEADRDVLLLCTDGLVEEWGGPESGRVLEIASHGRRRGVQALVERLFERSESEAEDEHRDDRTALALRARAHPGGRTA